ncbi:MAG TPA: hypothetical protein VNX28_13565 [Gemmataceae bacterium]|jgi:hypothetical protein|nr:hypothetical protein [Gemmataceae bacterium]
MKLILCGSWLVLAVGLVGCASNSPETKNKDTAQKGEEEIKEAFVSLQDAIKAKDANKIWHLLDKDSQADADREAKIVKETYTKLPEMEKAGLEKKLELTAKDLADMSGKDYVKSKRFYGKHHEIPGSKVEKITVAGASATLAFIEEDGDKITTKLARENGLWKFNLEIPKSLE